MKEIKLTQGKVAVVDDADYRWLNKFKWYAYKNRNTFYAARSIRLPDGKWTTIIMHREILGMGLGDRREVDHRNHNGLDNQWDNLRICTCAQNQYNQVPQRNRSSAFKGVYWRKDCNKWRAKIQINCRRIHLGNFESEIEAARAYDKAAVNHFGEFAYTNIRDNELVILGIV